MTKRKVCQTNPPPTIKQEVMLLQNNLDKTTWWDDVMANKCYLILDAQKRERVKIRLVDLFPGQPRAIVETSATNSKTSLG